MIFNCPFLCRFVFDLFSFYLRSADALLSHQMLNFNSIESVICCSFKRSLALLPFELIKSICLLIKEKHLLKIIIQRVWRLIALPRLICAYFYTNVLDVQSVDGYLSFAELMSSI